MYGDIYVVLLLGSNIFLIVLSISMQTNGATNLTDMWTPITFEFKCWNVQLRFLRKF